MPSNHEGAVGDGMSCVHVWSEDVELVMPTHTIKFVWVECDIYLTRSFIWLWIKLAAASGAMRERRSISLASDPAKAWKALAS